MPPNPNNSARYTGPKVRVRYQGGEEFKFRDSSIASHSTLGAAGLRSGGGSVGSIDDKEAAESTTAGLEHCDTFISSPPCPRQGPPVTRAKTRANGQTIDASGQNDNGISVRSDSQAKNCLSKSKGRRMGNNEHQLPLHLAHQHPPTSKAKQKSAAQYVSGLDGSLESHNSADGGGSASPVPETKHPKINVDDDDDEYRISESEDENNDSEQSVINAIRRNLRKTPNKQPTKPSRSSKPKGKQTAKSRTARGVRQKGDVIQDSQDVVKDSQENVVLLKNESKAINSRRPKKPFRQDTAGTQQTNPSQATSTCNINVNRQLSVRRGNTSSPSDKEDLQGHIETQATNEIKQTVLSARQSEAGQSIGIDNVMPEVDEGEGITIDQHPLPLTSYQTDNSSNELSDPIVIDENGDVHLLSSPTQHTEAESSKDLISFDTSELLVNQTKTIGATGDDFENVDVPTQIHLPLFGSGTVPFGCAAETKNEATQTKVSDIQSLLQSACHQRKCEEIAIGNDTNRDWFTIPLQVQDVNGPSRVDSIADRVQEENEQAKGPEMTSMKASNDFSNMVESLHPVSRAWAQGIAKRSRQDNLKTSTPRTTAQETEPLGRTPRRIPESPENPTTRRETALRGQRKAMFESVQEVTMAVLQHLKHKESAIDGILETYRQSGQQVIDMLLDRQSIELHQAAADFDNKCTRLGNLLKEGTRHARMIEKKMSNPNSPHLEDWEQKNKELQEMIRMARDALSSV